MRNPGIAKRVGAALLGLLALWSMAAGPATVISSVYAQSTSSGPRTWHVLVGGQSKDQAIQAEGYYPRVITIDAGDTVVWINKDPFPHTVTSSGATNHAFDSGEIAPNRSWKLMVRDKGQFSYVCTLHPTMKASLVVK